MASALQVGVADCGNHGQSIGRLHHSGIVPKIRGSIQSRLFTANAECAAARTLPAKPAGPYLVAGIRSVRVKTGVDVGSLTETFRIAQFPPAPTDGVIVTLPDPRVFGLRAAYRF